jgi:hypothetical protein
MYNSIALIVGHLIGDFVLQNDWMARNKSKPGLHGWWACFIHCWLYAAAVATCVVQGGWETPEPYTGWQTWFCALGIAFATHLPIDRWGWAGRWMRFFRQTLPDKLDSVVVPVETSQYEPWRARNVALYVGPRQYFWAPVYIGVANGMHLLLMWLLYSWMGVSTC